MFHPECLFIEVQAVFCQHPHVVTAHGHGTARARGSGAAGSITSAPSGTVVQAPFNGAGLLPVKWEQSFHDLLLQVFSFSA